jgi:NTE family protein
MDIVLALGGGGSKGNAHIGVLRVLEREGFTIRAIAGTSAGGMAAAAYAAGFDADSLEAHMKNVDQGKFYALHIGDKPALFGVDGIARALSQLIEERRFTDLNIPCAVNAVDLKTNREVILNQGRVVDALLATIALPGIFPPKEWGDNLLVDGGILNPVPVSVARAISPEPGLPVVAVSLTPALDDDVEIHSVNLLKTTPILKPIASLKVAQAFDIFVQSLEMGICAIADLRLEIDQPDVIIRPRVEHVGYLEKVDINTVVKLGEQAAEEMLPKLRRVARRQRRKSRRRKVRNP